MRAMIAMSGGVDSSVAALLMKQAGYDCAGVTMRLFRAPGMERASQKSCCSDADEDDAAYVCWQLGIPFESLCCTKEFEKTVIQNFIREYEAGRTPNPCIVCNRCLKFDLLLSLALEKGFDCLVTGHYARIAQDRSTGRWQLRKALDGSKDQSYVLYMLSQKQLSHLRFPLGELSKTDARAIAEKAGLVTASKHESQDICFIPDGDYGAFLEHWTGRCDPEGEILNLEGRVIGRHHGAIRYTIGQRRGLGVAAEQPLYVVAKDMEKHSVIVKDGKIVGRGHNRVVLNNDPTCHGEVSALRDAGQKLGTFDMSGCELYTTGEPCPMCLCACLWANIDKVYYGCTIEDNEIIGFRDEDFDELFGGREAFSDYLVCLDREACLELFDAYLNMERTNY